MYSSCNYYNTPSAAAAPSEAPLRQEKKGSSDVTMPKLKSVQKQLFPEEVSTTYLGISTTYLGISTPYVGTTKGSTERPNKVTEFAQGGYLRPIKKALFGEEF